MARLQDPNEWASSVSAVGFSQFYKSPAVRRKRISQPVLMGEEGRKQGVYGFGAELFCPCCGEQSDFLLIEFENAPSGSSMAWGEVDLDEFKEDLMKCPKCGSRDLLFQLI